MYRRSGLGKIKRLVRLGQQLLAHAHAVDCGASRLLRSYRWARSKVTAAAEEVMFTMEATRSIL
jgi:hypothetical protein